MKKSICSFSSAPLFIFLVVLSFVFSAQVLAQVRLASMFSDNMVLQRQKEIPVWGWAEAGEKISVEFAGRSGKTVADAKGKWMVRLEPVEAGGPFEMTVRGNNTVTFTNVMVGEVWVCSGQSNMEFPLERSQGARDEIKNATNSDIRLFSIPKTISEKPKDDVEASWQVCIPDFADNFSAVAYHFGKYINSQLDVPIGLIQSAYGGSKIEPWMTIDAYKQVPSLSNVVEYIEGSDQVYREKIAEALDALEIYLPMAKKSIEAGEQVPAPMKWPVHPLARDKQQPTCLYNGMINPIIPFGIRGVIWYQGESNHEDGLAYFPKMQALINGWRQIWNQGDFPFYYVQLAPFNYRGIEPTELPRTWEAQTACLQIPNTGMAVTVDIGNIWDIHPKNKQDVGKRLALWALAKDYGMEDIVYSGPLYKSMEIKDGKVYISFDHVGKGLKSRDGKALSWFSIAGEDKEFYPAKAKIKGKKVVVSSKLVPNPVAVRFGWDQKAEPNLSNKNGLPASPFRTDNW